MSYYFPPLREPSGSSSETLYFPPLHEAPASNSDTNTLSKFIEAAKEGNALKVRALLSTSDINGTDQVVDIFLFTVAFLLFGKCTFEFD